MLVAMQVLGIPNRTQLRPLVSCAGRWHGEGEGALRWGCAWHGAAMSSRTDRLSGVCLQSLESRAQLRTTSATLLRCEHTHHSRLFHDAAHTLEFEEPGVQAKALDDLTPVACV
jgi:hypothetical protein